MGQYAGSDIVLESNSLLRAVFFIPKNKERQVTVMRQAVTTMQYVFAGIGGFMGWFLGGLDGFLYALLMFVVIDYATGLMAAFVQKKVSSEVGFKGICKIQNYLHIFRNNYEGLFQNNSLKLCSTDIAFHLSHR